MIANINPSNTTYEDSHNTLKYSNRAKNIKVNPAMKETKQGSTWMEREQRLREENAVLKQRIVELEAIIEDFQNGFPSCKPQFIAMDEENESSVLIVEDDAIEFDSAINIENDVDINVEDATELNIEQDMQLEDIEVEQSTSEPDTIVDTVEIEASSNQKRKRDDEDVQTIEDICNEEIFMEENNVLSDSILEAGLFDEDSVVISKPVVKGNKKRRGSFLPIRGPKVDNIEEENAEPALKKSDRVTDAKSPVPNPRPRRLLRSSISGIAPLTEDQENHNPNQLVPKPQARRKSLAAVTALLDSIDVQPTVEEKDENRRSTRSRGANVISGLVTRITSRGKSIAPITESKSTISTETWLDI